MVLQDGDGVTIVDAGGGTIDISSYSKNVTAAKETFEEVAAPQCTLHSLSDIVLFRRVITIRSFLWLRLRQHPCEALLGEYVSLLSIINLSFYTSVQISWQIRHSWTILIISFDVLIKRRNYASEKLKKLSISNLGPLGIMMRPITFASAS